MVEEVSFLKKDFKQKENKYFEDFFDMKSLKEKVEDKLIKQDQSLQTVHMLCRPRPNPNELNRVAIGYKNPLCLTRAKQVQPALYNGHEIIKDNHKPTIVYDTEDTLEIAEITIKKMNDKMNDSECVTRKALTKEVKEMKDVFEELKAEVAQYAVDRKQLFCVETNSELNVARFTEMYVANTTAEARCLALEAELANLHDTNNHDNQNELINHFYKLEVNHLNLQLKYQNLKDSTGNNPSTPDKDTPDFDSVFVIGKMQASLQGKDNVIRQLKKQLSQLQVTRSDTDRLKMIKSSSTTKSCMTPLRSYVLSISNRNNRDAHLDYLRHLKESVEIIHDIVEEAKVVRPRDRSIVSACRYTKHSQELSEYAIGTCPQGSQQRAKQLGYTHLIRKKQVTVAKPSDKLDSTTDPHAVTVKFQKTNVPVPPSTGVNSYPNASRSQPKSHVKSNRISPAKGVNKLPVEDQPRTNKSRLRTSNRVDSSSRRKHVAKKTVIPNNRYLKFSAKGTKREVFGMPIPSSLITADIREASYYQEYLANVTKHRRFLTGETRSAQDSPAPKPAKPARKPKPTAQKDRINILQIGNLNAGSVTSFSTVISFTDSFSASSSDKTWNLILRLKTRRIFRNLESFVGG
nr:integrase, catalytic region, zinc finger, CCHC-type, peptidase aspartic, catalytic [Tanacetum cinerariifolium]